VVRPAERVHAALRKLLCAVESWVRPALVRWRVPPLLVAATAAFLALGQVDGLLRRLQSENASASGLQSLVLGWPNGELFARARGVIEFWHSGGRHGFVERCVVTYTLLDVLFIALYSSLALVVLYRLCGTSTAGADAGWLSRQARAPLGCVLALAAVDLIEDALLLAVATRRLPGTDAVLLTCLAATAIKWILVLVVVGLVAARLRERSAWFSALVTDTWRSLWALRTPALLSVAFGLLLLGDPTGQASDLLRRWMDSDWTGAWSIAATGAFGLGLWAAARRILLGRYNPPNSDVSPPQWLILGLGTVLVAGGLWRDLTRLAGVGGVILVVWAAGGLRYFFGLRELVAQRASRALDERSDSAKFPPARDIGALSDHDHRRLAAIQRTARAIAIWPLVALGLAVARAFTAPPLVLVDTDAGGARGEIETTLIALGGAVGAATTVWGGTALLRRADARLEPRSGLMVLVPAGAASALALAEAIANPLDVAPKLGVVALLALMFTVITVGLAELERQAETRIPPLGLVMLGFRRTPVLLLVLVALLGASLASPNDDHHNVARMAGPTPPDVDPARAWYDWAIASCAGDEGGPIPLVIVGAHGGGARAAYWTATAMTALVPKPRAPAAGRCGEVLHQVFALSGISGGSVGFVNYISWAEQPTRLDWYESELGRPDALASAIAWLAVDSARAFVGFDAEDRARLLERAWERHHPGLSRDFFSVQSPPYLMLGGSTVDSGCRMNVSSVRLSARPDVDPKRLVAECAALEGRAGTVGATSAPAAAQLTDVIDHLCGLAWRLRLSTAALLSARFPYVSPSGRFPACGTTAAPTAVVDGGYVEGTGARSALDLWRAIEPLVARHNRAAWRRDRRRGRLVVPVYVQLDNHYSAVAAAAPPGRTQELIVPEAAKLRANSNDDRAIEQEIRAAFSAPIPGVPRLSCEILTSGRPRLGRYVRIAPVVSPGLPAPLAWTLSKMSRDDLLQQLRKAMGKRGNAVRELLTGRFGFSCSPPTARSHAKPFGVRAASHP
jgi:hypothetical protein